MKPRIQPIWILLLLVICSNVHGQANSWTNTNFGKWETNSNWSLGVAPTNTQSFTFITNAPSKTVTIDAITSGTRPGTLTISNLTVSAPLGSANTLFLNNSGLGTPLRILRSMSISNNATLLLFSNAVVQVGGATGADSWFVDSGGFVNVLGGGSLISTNADVRVGFLTTGVLNLSEGTLIGRAMIVGDGPGSQGTVTISGGNSRFNDFLDLGENFGATGTMWLTGGLLVTTNNGVNVGPFGVGQMAVSNGTWRARAITVGLFNASRGTLTYAGGTNFVSEHLQLGAFNASTGTVVVSGGQLFVTNLANTASIDIRTGSLTVTGAIVSADQLIATNNRATIQFPAGTMTLRGAVVNTANSFVMGGAGRTAVLNLVGGTNNFISEVDVAAGGNSTGVVWVAGGQLVATNGFFLLGLNGVGQMTVSNGNNSIGDMSIGMNGGSRGTWTIAGGTNQITTELLIGTGSTSTGVVLLTGGQLVVTNNNIVTAVGYTASGEMTVFPNGKLLSSRLSVGFASGSRGTFTLAGATLDLPTTVTGVTVGENPGATGTVWLSTGSLIVTNFDVESVVGLAGNGQMTVSNAFLRTSDFRVGRNAGSRGTLTMAGGTNQFDSFLSIGSSANATGTVWVTGGRVVVTNNIISLGAGVGQFIVSNGVVLAKEINVTPGVSGRGTFTMSGGTVTLDTLTVINPTSRIVFNAGNLTVTNSTRVANNGGLFVGENGGGSAILNLIGGTHEVTNFFVVGLNTTGQVWLTGGQLIVSNASTFIGETPLGGQLTLSNATLLGKTALVGSSGGAGVGTLTSVNSTIKLSSFLELGSFEDFGGDKGTVWINGGQLVVTNDVTRVGSRGDGTITVSNGTVLLKELQIATNSTAHGTVTAAGGAINVSGPVTLGFSSGATGTLWMTGGQLTATNSTNFVAFSGVGRMTISNGTWRARDAFVGFGPGSSGLLEQRGGTNVITSTLKVDPIGAAAGAVSVAGGISSVYSNMTIGNYACSGVATVNVTGGELRVTNSAGNAVLEVCSGTLTQSGGLLQVNKLVITNSCARFIHTGGVLLANVVTLSTNRFADADGDGIDNKWEQDHGLDPFNPADALLDNDGDGQNNLEEFTMGTDPNDLNSSFRIISIARTNNDVRITWTVAPTSGNGLFLSYNVQFGTNLLTGVTNNLAQINVGPGFAGTTTNFLDVGGATNQPTRFYRIEGFID